MSAEPEAYRAGFACLVGRPNAGKSTLTNALVGSKVAITSSKPQTTRHAVRGIRTTPTSQLILVDTPGLHRPRSLLGQRLNDVVRETLLSVDVIGFCLPSDQRVGPGDTFIARDLLDLHRVRRVPVVAIATKSDAVTRDRLAEHLVAIDQLGDWDAIIPCSATGGEQVEEVADVLASYLPASPALYPADQITDESTLVQIAELVREAALEKVRQEVPHSLAVSVEEIVRKPDPRDPDAVFTELHVLLHCERPSQKPMLLGKGGATIKAIGSEARVGLEHLLGGRVHLALHVTVLGEWQDDPKKLQRLGY